MSLCLQKAKPSRTAIYAARLALEGRFGPLDDALVAVLANADEATCEALVARITTDSPEQVRARLGIV